LERPVPIRCERRHVTGTEEHLAKRKKKKPSKTANLNIELQVSTAAEIMYR